MGTRRIEIEYPDELLQEVDEHRLAAVAREAFVVKFFEQGLIGSGKGGELLGITRWDFLDLLGRCNVSYFDEDMDLDEEMRVAGRHRCQGQQVAGQPTGSIRWCPSRQPLRPTRPVSARRAAVVIRPDAAASSFRASCKPRL